MKSIFKQNGNSKFKGQNFPYGGISRRKTKPQFKGQNRTEISLLLFSVDIIKFLETLPEKRVYWIIADQLLRAATSIGANIVEAKSASSKRDFLKFYEIALKSANETKYWLGLLRDATDANKNRINELLKEVEEISNMISASVLTMKNKR